VIRVLIVEDDPDAAVAHVEYVDRVPGFQVIGHAATGRAALRRLAGNTVDLLLLDIYLPDIHGLEILRRLRASGNTIDVMTMTRARDLAVVQAAVSLGVTQYLVKPFTFAVVRHKLEKYLTYRAELERGPLIAQTDVDRLLGLTREAPPPAALPSGVARASLATVASALEALPADRGLTAAEAAGVMGVSRATARRYLEYLCEAGLVERQSRYGGAAGRPDVEYRWRASHQHDRPH
jgi:response regulator of citrate/malate metabolism